MVAVDDFLERVAAVKRLRIGEGRFERLGELQLHGLRVGDTRPPSVDEKSSKTASDFPAGVFTTAIKFQWPVRSPGRSFTGRPPSETSTAFGEIVNIWGKGVCSAAALAAARMSGSTAARIKDFIIGISRGLRSGRDGDAGLIGFANA